MGRLQETAADIPHGMAILTKTSNAYYLVQQDIHRMLQEFNYIT